MNLATQLREIATIRAILLQQYGTKLSTDVINSYSSILDDIRNRILSHDELNAARTAQIIKEIKEVVFPKLPIYDEFKQFALDERDWLVSSTNQIAGAEIFKAIPPESVIVSIAKNASIGSGKINEWFAGLDASLRFKLTNSMLQGENTQEAAKRFADISGIAMNQAETLVRTGISDISSKVREEVYKDNESVIGGREFSAVLDNRTSLGCATRDGATYDNEYKGINDKGKRFPFKQPPLHPRCRSIITPLLKSWEELGIDLKEELPETTRASMDGQVSSEITFDKWLKTKDDKFIEKYLGKKRAELYLDGKISLSDLVTKNGRTKTLDELRGI